MSRILNGFLLSCIPSLCRTSCRQHSARFLRRRQSQIRCHHTRGPASRLPHLQQAKPRSFSSRLENQMVSPFSDATIRFGMDGSWVGANNGNSYFALTVDPGVHHLCASWQSVLGTLKKNVGLTLFTAEPGSIYYFAAQVTVTSRDNVTFALSQLNEDEGKYRLKLSKLSTSNPKDARRRGTSCGQLLSPRIPHRNSIQRKSVKPSTPDLRHYVQ